MVKRFEKIRFLIFFSFRTELIETQSRTNCFTISRNLIIGNRYSIGNCSKSLVKKYRIPAYTLQYLLSVDNLLTERIT